MEGGGGDEDKKQGEEGIRKNRKTWKRKGRTRGEKTTTMTSNKKSKKEG